jgi:hypothetical protein
MGFSGGLASRKLDRLVKSCHWQPAEFDDRHFLIGFGLNDSDAAAMPVGAAIGVCKK